MKLMLEIAGHSTGEEISVKERARHGGWGKTGRERGRSVEVLP